jgi:threonine dehydrogenase-like Zn-dependent dehydrogenase
MTMRTRLTRLYGQRDLRVEAADVAEPGEGEVLVKMAAGGICGSDLHYYQDGGFGPVRVREPIIPGHEASGHIAALGSGVSGLALGDLVAINPSQPCGACRSAAKVSRFIASTCNSWAAQCGCLIRRACSATGSWFPQNYASQPARW